jgi:hypothetical protein
MAMAKCKECGKEVSKSADKCPNCGVAHPGITPTENLGAIIFMLTACVFIFWQIGIEGFSEMLGLDAKTESVSSRAPSPSTALSIPQKTYNVNVEDLTVDKQLKNAWGIKGRIRNLENKPLKGYVKIKFLDSKGDIVKSAMAPVNGNDYLKSNQAGPFKYYTSPADFNNVTKYDVVFVGS